jgi:uncharacterized protein HemX
MISRAQRPTLALVALAVALCLGLATNAGAQGKSKSIKTEAEFIAYDAEKQAVLVKVKKPGSGKAAKKLKRNKKAAFQVKPGGSVLTRTTVAIQGRKAELTDIPEGKTVNIYWRPDEKDESARFARKIDVILSDEELDKRYGVE